MNKSNLERFIKKARLIHGDKYDYSRSVYVKAKEKICIICPIHGEFWQTARNHLYLKQGCPRCSESILEKSVCLFLEKEHFTYEKCKHFPWLGKQHLDFYLPKYKLAIECQGIQHYKPIEFFGGDEAFKQYLSLDKRKLDACKQNGVKLIYYSNVQDSNAVTNENELLKKIQNVSAQD